MKLRPPLPRRTTAPSYNEVQLRVMAEADCFVSVQGGTSYLSAYFAGEHIYWDTTRREAARRPVLN